MVSGYNFQPAKLTVKVGTTVHFVNTDTIDHTVTADDNSFDSGDLPAGKTYDFTFTKAGTYPFYCAIHGAAGGVGMSGIITVTAS